MVAGWGEYPWATAGRRGFFWELLGAQRFATPAVGSSRNFVGAKGFPLSAPTSLDCTLE